MITCPVCRFDNEPQASLCADCETPLSAEAQAEGQAQAEAKQEPLEQAHSSQTQTDQSKTKEWRVNQRALGVYLLTKALDDGSFIARHDDGHSVRLSRLKTSQQVTDMVLGEAKHQVSRLKHPHVVKLLDAHRLSDHDIVLVEAPIDTPTLSDLLNSEKGATFALNGSNVLTFMIDLCKLISLVQRSHALEDLSPRRISISETGQPQLHHLLLSRLNRYGFTQDQEDKARAQDQKQLVSLLMNLAQQLFPHGDLLTEQQAQIMNVLRGALRGDDKLDSASRLVSALSAVRSPQAKSKQASNTETSTTYQRGRPPTQKLRPSRRYDRGTQRLLGSIPVNMPTPMGTGAPNISAGGQRERPRFVPRALIEERVQRQRQAMLQQMQSKRAATRGEIGQLRDDLLFVHLGAWITPWLLSSGLAGGSLSSGLSFAAGSLIAPLGLFGAAHVTAKNMDPAQALVLFLGIGFVLAVVFQTGGIGFLMAMVLAIYSVFRTEDSSQSLRQTPDTQEEVNLYLKQKLKSRLDHNRLLLAGGMSMLLANLPAALSATHLGGHLFQAFASGVLATFMAVNSYKKSKQPGALVNHGDEHQDEHRAGRHFGRYIFFAGLFCLLGYLTQPRALLTAGLTTLLTTIGFGELINTGVFAGALGEEEPEQHSLPQTVTTPNPGVAIQLRPSERLAREPLEAHAEAPPEELREPPNSHDTLKGSSRSRNRPLKG